MSVSVEESGMSRREDHQNKASALGTTVVSDLPPLVTFGDCSHLENNLVASD